MNTKMLLSFFAGVGLTLAVVLFMVLATPYARAQESIVGLDTTDGTGASPLWDLPNLFGRVRSEIQCQNTAQFYDKLIAAYSLPEAIDIESLDESTDWQTLLPDINGIQRTALTLPLYEAGKNIKDEGLQEFYYSFLQEAGLLTNAQDG